MVIVETQKKLDPIYMGFVRCEVCLLLFYYKLEKEDQVVSPIDHRGSSRLPTQALSPSFILAPPVLF
jgi:hypothetical protein